MKTLIKNLDIKSIMIGFLVCGLMLSSMGNGSDPIPKEGRYQIASGSDTTVYIVDTATGKLWRRDDRGVSDLGTPDKPIHLYQNVDKIIE